MNHWFKVICDTISKNIKIIRIDERLTIKKNEGDKRMHRFEILWDSDERKSGRYIYIYTMKEGDR